MHHPQREKLYDRDIGIDFVLGRFARIGLAISLLCACPLLVIGIITNFTVGSLTDERASIPLDILSAASNAYMSSARLHARVAQVSEEEGDLVQAEEHAVRAIRLSPQNFNYRLLLASIEEAGGDVDSAEQSLRSGLSLAPNKTEVHWQLANVLLRKGDLDEAVDHFREACALNVKLLPLTLNLAWRFSSENPDVVESITGNQPGARLKLAEFFLKHENVDKAVKVFSQLGPRVRQYPTEARQFLDGLIAAGELQRARDLWVNAIGDTVRDIGLIWNGSFESEIAKDFTQFDWITYNDEYARIRIGNGAAHTGERSLRIEFAGRDTTRLDGEIKQIILVRPNAHYKLQYYANAEKLVSPEGPRVVVRPKDSKDQIAASEPIVAGKAGWQRFDFDVDVPPSPNSETVPLVITIVRRPKFSYDEPTRGTVYFDDFTLTEQPDAIGARLSSNTNRN
jgi:tetratricopeptide (TPR) repeat protein